MLDTGMESKNESEAAPSSAAPGNRWQNNTGVGLSAPRAWLAEGWAYSTLPESPVAEAPRARTLETSLAPAYVASHWRTPGPPEALHILTRNWLARMPETLRPPELVRSFPHIANNMSRLWAQPKDCAAYLNSLLTDTRNGTRKGFPKGVAAELVTLRRQMEQHAQRMQDSHDDESANGDIIEGEVVHKEQETQK